MSNQYSTVGLIVRPNDTGVSDTLSDVYHLLEARGIEILLDHSTRGLIGGPLTVGLDDIGQRADLVVVIGGDGTLLHAAREMVTYGVPLLGVNRGRLGFLVDVCPQSNLTVVNQILDGEHVVDERFLLDCEVLRDDQVLHRSHAFNDVILKVADQVRIIEFETFVDGVFMSRQNADGAIVATPSGSTAYALSNGGPILMPGQDSMLIMPLSPHTLASRPLIISADHCVEIQINNRDAVTAHVVSDGQVYLPAENGDVIRVTRKPERIVLLHPKDYDYFEILRAKLNWR